MKYETKRSQFAGEWVVEAINHQGDGEVYVASFSGPQAEERAREYAQWKEKSVRQHITV